MRVAKGINSERVSMAIDLLSQTRPVTEQVRELIENLIPSPNHAISIAALRAAATLQMPVARYRDPIAHLLRVYAEDSILLIDLIAQQGRKFESLDTLVCHHLAESVQYSNQAATGKLVDCLHKISADPEAVIRREIKDPDIQALVLASVSDAVEHSD